MTQGGNDPLTPLHRLSTASLNGVVRAFAYHRYFRFFLSLFFSTPLNEFFQIQPYLITDFDCWLCYFRYSLSTQTLRAAPSLAVDRVRDESTAIGTLEAAFDQFLQDSKAINIPSISDVTDVL